MAATTLRAARVDAHYRTLRALAVDLHANTAGARPTFQLDGLLRDHAAMLGSTISSSV